MPREQEIIAEYCKVWSDTQYYNYYIENYRKGYKEGKKCSKRKLTKQLIVQIAYASGKERGMCVKLDNKQSNQRRKMFAKMRETNSGIRLNESGTN